MKMKSLLLQKRVFQCVFMFAFISSLFLANCGRENKSVDYPNKVLTSIPVESGYRYLTILPNGEYIYAANFNNNLVAVIKFPDNVIVNSITVGEAPWSIIASPNSDFVYVGNRNSLSVSVIRTEDNTLIDTIVLGYTPYGMAIDPNGEYLYVANSSNSVFIIEMTGNTILDTIPLDGKPFGLAIDSAGEYLYVTLYDSCTVSVVDLSIGSVIQNINLGDLRPEEVIVLPNGEYVYVTSTTISVISTADHSVIKETVGYCVPKGYVASLPNSKYVYVTNPQPHNILVIRVSDNAVVEYIEIGNFLHDIAIHPDGNFAYVVGTKDIFVIGFE